MRMRTDGFTRLSWIICLVNGIVPILHTSPTFVGQWKCSHLSLHHLWWRVSAVSTSSPWSTTTSHPILGSCHWSALQGLHMFVKMSVLQSLLSLSLIVLNLVISSLARATHANLTVQSAQWMFLTLVSTCCSLVDHWLHWGRRLASSLSLCSVSNRAFHCLKASDSMSMVWHHWASL